MSRGMVTLKMFTTKPVNKGHQREREFRHVVSLFYFIKEGLSESDLYLQDDPYWEVVFNTGLTVFRYCMINR